MILLFLSALVLSFVLTGLATFYARRRGLIDHPVDRSSHSVPTPRGGGAGWVSALLLFIAVHGFVSEYTLPVLSVVLACGLGVLAITGWWDDHHDLAPAIRAFFQVTVAVAALFVLWMPQDHYAWASAVLLILFIAWMVNLYNFMDGSNGLAGFQGVFVSLVLSGLFARAGDMEALTLSLLLTACLAGFLPWNLGRARVFMGDVGSLALGYAVAILLVHGVVSDAFPLPVALMATALFLLDASLTLAVRVMRGEQWYNAHRQHLYQRLIAIGWPHGRVLLVYQGVNVLLVLPAVVFGVNHPEWAWLTALALGLVLGTGWYLSIQTVGMLAEAKTIR